MPIFILLSQFAFYEVSLFLSEDNNYISDIFLEFFSIALGEISIKFLPCILKISNKENIKEKKIKKKRFLHYFLLCLFNLINQGLHYYTILFLKDVSKQTFSYSNLFMIHNLMILALEMIFVYFISKSLLKYVYYRHHIISISASIMVGIISELIINEFELFQKNNILSTFIQILNASIDALYFCYQKYMMEKLYYPYWNVTFISGIFMIIVGIVILTIFAIFGDFSDLNFNLSNGKIIAKIIFYLIIHLFLCPLVILAIFYFNPILILITIQLITLASGLFVNIHNFDSIKSSLYCLPFYFVQIFAFVIFLEKIEINICNLNKYTKINIELRSLEDLIDKGRDSTHGFEAIDINDDYSIDNKVEKSNNFELEQKEDNDESNTN